MQDVVCEVGNDRGSLASRNLVVLELVDGEGEVGLLVFSARDCRLRAAARGRRGAGGRPCPCPRDVRGHVCWWSVSECRYATVWKNVPLQIIGSGVLVLSVWTERTHVAGGLVHETVSDHLVFTLEALPALASRAAFDGAEVRPCLRVDVGVRTGQSISMCTGCLQRDDLLQKVLRLERGRCTVWLFTLVSPRKALWDVCKTGSNRRW